MTVRTLPRGIVQRSYGATDGRTMWLVSWQAGQGPNPVPSDLRLETGQAVVLTPEGELARLRR
jgi:hypothetical protein